MRHSGLDGVSRLIAWNPSCRSPGGALPGRSYRASGPLRTSRVETRSTMSGLLDTARHFRQASASARDPERHYRCETHFFDRWGRLAAMNRALRLEAEAQSALRNAILTLSEPDLPISASSPHSIRLPDGGLVVIAPHPDSPEHDFLCMVPPWCETLNQV
jgi:hypothetical protein